MCPGALTSTSDSPTVALIVLRCAFCIAFAATPQHPRGASPPELQSKIHKQKFSTSHTRTPPPPQGPRFSVETRSRCPSSELNFSCLCRVSPVAVTLRSKISLMTLASSNVGILPNSIVSFTDPPSLSSLPAKVVSCNPPHHFFFYSPDRGYCLTFDVLRSREVKYDRFTIRHVCPRLHHNLAHKNATLGRMVPIA